jgi:hypothetical protein
VITGLDHVVVPVNDIEASAMAYQMLFACAPALSRCSAITDDAARLSCYDRLATPHEPAKGALAPVRIYPPEESK